MYTNDTDQRSDDNNHKDEGMILRLSCRGDDDDADDADEDDHDDDDDDGAESHAEGGIMHGITTV